MERTVMYKNRFAIKENGNYIFVPYSRYKESKNIPRKRFKVVYFGYEFDPKEVNDKFIALLNKINNED